MGSKRRMQTDTRHPLWDKMNLAKDIELPILEWFTVEW